MDITEKNILSIGPEFVPPRGGIAQTVSYYSTYVFSDQFRYISNSCYGSNVRKLLVVFIAFVRCLYLFLFVRQIKIVHIHSASYFSFRRSVWFLRFSKLFGKTVILHIHGGGFKTYYQGKRKYVLNNLARADAVIALSPQWKRFFERDLGLKHVFIINNIVPKVDYDRARNYETDCCHALFMGAITAKKGAFDLINSLGDHSDYFRGKLVVHLAGNGEIEQANKLISERNINDIVHCEGWVGPKKKQELFKLCRIFVLPSYVEGVPLSILEAMSHQMPIIASKVGGIPSIVENGKNGLLVTPANTEELANAIAKLLDDPSLRFSMSEASYQRVQSHFPEAVRKQIWQVYTDLQSCEFTAGENCSKN